MGGAEGGWTEQSPGRWNGRSHPAESCLAAWKLARAPALRPGRRGDRGPEPRPRGVHAVTRAAAGHRRTSARPRADQRAARFRPSVTSSRLRLNKTQLRRPHVSMQEVDLDKLGLQLACHSNEQESGGWWRGKRKRS